MLKRSVGHVVSSPNQGQHSPACTGAIRSDTMGTEMNGQTVWNQQTGRVFPCVWVKPSSRQTRWRIFERRCPRSTRPTSVDHLLFTDPSSWHFLSSFWRASTSQILKFPLSSFPYNLTTDASYDANPILRAAILPRMRQPSRLTERNTT